MRAPGAHTVIRPERAWVKQRISNYCELWRERCTGVPPGWQHLLLSAALVLSGCGTADNRKDSDATNRKDGGVAAGDGQDTRASIS